MRPRERRESGERDLFRARLDQIIDTKDPLVRLARTIDWGFLEATFGAVYQDGAGRPPLPTRLMAGLGESSRSNATFKSHVRIDSSDCMGNRQTSSERTRSLFTLL